jgi:hypothetical protein
LADAAQDILRPLTFQSLVLQQVDVVQVGRAFQSLHGRATADTILVGWYLLHVFCTLVYIHTHQVLLVIPVWLRSLVIQLKTAVLADWRSRTTIMLLVSRFLEHSQPLWRHQLRPGIWIIELDIFTFIWSNSQYLKRNFVCLMITRSHGIGLLLISQLLFLLALIPMLKHRFAWLPYSCLNLRRLLKILLLNCPLELSSSCA